MIDYKKHKSNFSPYLEKLYQSDKPMIIYKYKDGYKIFTDFSKRIVLNNSNIEKFLNNISKKKFKREQDLYVGFFGYEILCNLLNIRIKNQKKNGFYKGLFYKPETIITLSKKIKISSTLKKQSFHYHFNQTKILKPFKVNINFEKYKKELPLDKITQIHICSYSIDNDLNQAYDAHNYPNNQELLEVGKIISEYEGTKYLTVEYYKEIENLKKSLKNVKDLI